MKKIALILGFFSLIIFKTTIYAQENSNSFITLVNPVRMAPYNKNPLASIQSEYQQVNKYNFSATWLISYDLLAKAEYVNLFKQMDGKQELGILMEISPDFSNAAGIKYNQSDSWHRSSALFLIGYYQSERIKFIDTIFKKFKDDFGYYPKSVGAWWIDSYSLEYMHNKYGITGNLALADQFSTDSYQVWGSYWSTPFYPSKYNEAQPARTLGSKINLVNLEWAPRDPLNGYLDSVHSTQDYYTINLPLDYFSSLVNLYTHPNKNQFNQITLGLEGDLSPDSYNNQYSQWMDTVKNYQLKGVNVTNMQDFSSWYKNNFPDLSPSQVIETDDLLGEPIKSIWYQSPDYRIGLTYDSKLNQTKVIDFRVYTTNFFDPYYINPIKTTTLFENIPSIIDSFSNPKEEFILSNSKISDITGNNHNYQINFADNSSIKFNDDGILLQNFNTDNFPISIKNSPYLKVINNNKNLQIFLNEQWITDENGYPFIDYIIEKPNILRSKRNILIIGIILIILIVLYSLLIKKTSNKLKKRILFISPILLLLISLSYYLFFINHRYFVNQSEVDALTKLSFLPKGKIIVVDQECITCGFDTPFKPAVLANKRRYVSDLSQMPIIYDSLLFTTKSRAEAKEHIASLGAKYIYLARYGDYQENLQFSPGDYGIQKIYENATSQIWEVVN